MAQQIGFIGVGLMGHGMAKNLVEKGFAVTVMAHRNRQPVEDLVRRGAKEAPSLAALIRGSRIVLTCVTGSPQVEEVVYGADGILKNAAPDLIFVDTSTSEPPSTERIARDLGAKGIRMADAPLTRTPVEAEAGRLNSIVGASEEVFAEIEPLLRAYSENIFHVGPVGSGHKLKLVNNVLALSHAALLAEVMGVCAAAGIDLRRMYELVSVSGGDSRMLRLLVPKALEGDLTGLQFALANGEKDVRYYKRMTDSLPVASPIGSAVHQVYVQALALGLGDRFVGSLIEAQEKLTGRSIVSR